MPNPVQSLSKSSWCGGVIDPATDGELILVFTNAAAAANTLRSTLPISMRVLAIGGGGAGDYGATSSVGPGGGGGEVENLRKIGKGAENPRLFFSYEKNFVLSWIMI